MDGLFAQLLTTAFLATFIRSLVPLLLCAAALALLALQRRRSS